FNLRGTLRTDDAGHFSYRSVCPGQCALPSDGPVRALLDRLGAPAARPAHLQFRIAAPGFRTLTTMVFDRDDPAIGADALFGVKPALLAPFRVEGEGRAVAFTFVLAPVH
ncbi:MAG: 6-chlorohydroxyquinol-1,2-dioxygenase, partial [Pseudomonadota bacterium]